MIHTKSQKLNAKKKYSEPSIKEIGKINNITFGGGPNPSADSLANADPS